MDHGVFGTDLWHMDRQTYTYHSGMASRFNKQKLIRRWDSERELFNHDIAHT